MTSDRKAHFIDELKRHFTGVIAGARLAEVGAAETAAGMQEDVRRKEDAKAAAQFTRVSRGTRLPSIWASATPLPGISAPSRFSFTGDPRRRPLRSSTNT